MFLLKNINVHKWAKIKVEENIYRPSVFFNFFKNTQFFFFWAGIHLKLHFVSLFHFRLESVKKTNGNLKKDHFTPKTKITISP